MKTAELPPIPQEPAEPIAFDACEKALILTALRRCLWGLDLQLRADGKSYCERQAYDTAYFFGRNSERHLKRLVAKLEKDGWE